MKRLKTPYEKRLVNIMLIQLFTSIAFCCFIYNVFKNELPKSSNNFDINLFAIVVAIVVGLNAIITASLMLTSQTKASEEQREDLELIRNAIDRNTIAQTKTGDVQKDEMKPIFETIAARIKELFNENKLLRNKLKRLKRYDNNSIDNNPICCLIIKCKIKSNYKEIDKLINHIKTIK
jgi:uncharacterized membrane protein